MLMIICNMGMLDYKPEYIVITKVTKEMIVNALYEIFGIKKRK